MSLVVEAREVASASGPVGRDVVVCLLRRLADRVEQLEERATSFDPVIEAARRYRDAERPRVTCCNDCLDAGKGSWDPDWDALDGALSRWDTLEAIRHVTTADQENSR